tara:strand:+ start:1245 stop:1796 length:552 start_codon:yes stop_codon:yes gene_type:complete
MPWKLGNKIIREGRSWSADGITHPANWAIWSDADKKAAGLAWEDPPASFDNRFYWDASTPKALDDVNAVDENDKAILDEKGEQVVTVGLKSQWKAIIKQQAAGLLAPTDWYVTRKAEDSKATIPSDVTTYRAAVRTKSGTIEKSITDAADHAAFMALFDTPMDSQDPPQPTGNAPIADWPDEL